MNSDIANEIAVLRDNYASLRESLVANADSYFIIYAAGNYENIVRQLNGK